MSFCARHMAPIGRACPVALVALGLACAAQASERATFDVRIAGLTVGYVAYAAETDGARYVARSEVRSTGLAAAVRPFRFESRVEGQIAQGQLRPSRYEENADTGARQSRVRMAYSGGVPQILDARDDQDNSNVTPADPASQDGALDPMSVTYALLRDRPAGPDACRIDLDMFDGIRATRLAMRPSDDPLVCEGVYTRVEGFSPSDMAERNRFPIKITLSDAAPGLLEVKSISLQTLIGPATLQRR